MKSKTTVIWFVLAAALFAFIWFFENYLQPSAPVRASLLPGLRASDVTEIQVSPAGAREISALRTNGVWQLETPFAYPAQAAAIASLLDAVGKLAPDRLTAAELRERHATDSEFGFDNPQFALDLTAGEQSWHLRVGNKTAPGDQVYVRVVGTDGVFVADADWLRFLPREAAGWRDTALVAAAGLFDWIVITNGAKAIELRRDATNHLWRMIRPLDARADDARIATGLQQLRSASVTQFVTDDPHADLGGYGLQPPDLDVWLGHGTNFLAAIHAGKGLPENPAQIFVQREGWNSVLATAAEALSPWHAAVNDFRDPHLLELTAPVAEIEVLSESTNHFTLQQRGSNDWAVVGEKYPVDAGSVQEFIGLLAGFRIAGFGKDNNTPQDLQDVGLAAPSRVITLRSLAGDTNSAFVQLSFAETNKIFVKRADESFVYTLAKEDFTRLPECGWQFRDRRIWNFSMTNVAQITLRQNGMMRQIIHTGANRWSPAPGSTGIIDPTSIEQTVQQLSGLTAASWIGRDFTAPERYGLNPNNLQLTVELKTGEKLSVDFGTELPPSSPNAMGTALAAVTLEGERWVFIFPVVPYQLVAANLTLPPNGP
jgi:hypothetical protein